MKIIGATDIPSYLAGLTPEDREVINFVRDKINKVKDKKIEENFNRGMITREIPLSIYPITYNKQPLAFAACAKQKNYYALYLMVTYTGNNPSVNLLKQGFERIGKKPNMGKSCIRFQKIEDLPRPEIQQIIKECSAKKYIEIYEESRKGTKK